MPITLRLSCREGVETRYIVRTLVQNLRVNANWRSIIGPLARAVIMHRWEPGPDEASGQLHTAAKQSADAYSLAPTGSRHHDLCRVSTPDRDRLCLKPAKEVSCVS